MTGYDQRHILHARLKGSMTIEAAVIVPIAMVILVSIIYLAYYVHDQAVMSAVTDYAVMENAGKNDAGNAAQIINSLLGEKLYSVSGISAGADGGGGKLNADSSASFYMPLAMIRQILGQDTGSLSASVNASFLASRKKLLLYKSICDGVPELLKGGAS